VQVSQRQVEETTTKVLAIPTKDRLATP
jgi:hypothetical protein